MRTKPPQSLRERGIYAAQRNLTGWERGTMRFLAEDQAERTEVRAPTQRNSSLHPTVTMFQWTSLMRKGPLTGV